MKMLIFTFRDSLQDEVLSFLKQENIQAYTYVPKVHGVGQTGAAFGAFLSHGDNAIAMVTLNDEPASRTIESFRSFRTALSQRQQGAAIPLRLMVLPCEEII